MSFHFKLNEKFSNLEVGSVAKDINQATDGRWVFEDRSTQLNENDVIYYWVYVVYKGLGYILQNKSHRVTGTIRFQCGE